MEITQEGRKKITDQINKLKNDLLVISKSEKTSAADGDGNRFGYDSSFYAESVRKREILDNIKELEEILATSDIVEEFSGLEDAVKLRSVVNANLYYQDEEPVNRSFYIKETDVDEIPAGTMAITVKSPIGGAIFNHLAGETVIARIPNGSVKIEILEVVNEKTRR